MLFHLVYSCACRLALTASLACLCCASAFAQTQNFGANSGIAVPNPVPRGQGRINIWDPSRGQGGGQFGASRSGGRTHNGIDLSADVGTAVQATQGGRVIRSESSPPYCTVPDSTVPADPTAAATAGQVERRLSTAGNNVVILNADGTTSYYYHLNGDNQPQIGDRVVPGQVVGNVGRSGNVPDRADSHLHYEIRDSSGAPVRPIVNQPMTNSYSPQSSHPGTSNTSETSAGDIVGTSVSVVPRQAGMSSPTAGVRLPTVRFR